MSKGMTLVEMVVCVAIVAMLAMISYPIINAMEGSLVAGASMNCVSSSLGLARALAATNSKDVGVRFQSNDDGQYLIYVIKIPDPDPFDGIRDMNAFSVMENRKAIKLSGQMRAMEYIYSDSEINDDMKFNDKSCFTIVYSSNGKLSIRDVWVLPDGEIFGSQADVDGGSAMFAVDSNVEVSVSRFFTYNKADMARVGLNERYTACLSLSRPRYINRYTGQIIKN